MMKFFRDIQHQVTVKRISLLKQVIQLITTIN